MDENTTNEFAIYHCDVCYNATPVCGIPIQDNQEMLVCLSCRSVLDTEAKPLYTCSEYSLYKIGWSQKKINKEVKSLEERMEYEKD